MASSPTTSPSAPANSTPASTPSSGLRWALRTSQPVAYAADPMKDAWPNDSSPVYPSNRLNAQANIAKHSAFIMNTGYTPTKGATSRKASTTSQVMAPMR